MMRNSSTSGALFVSVLIFAIVAKQAAAQGDDFDDGNSDGWTELSPLAGFGVPGTFSFPDGNTYRMQSSPSPDEAALGQSRVGALREDVSYDDFYMFVDLVDHDLALDQNIGMLARVKEPGLGTLDGYSVTYNPTDQGMFFSVITDENGTNLDFGDDSVPVNPGDPVRLVFQGTGDMFKFEVFLLDDLENAVASFEISDSTYASGNCGVFVVTDGADPAKPTDCTFDNYFAAAVEPVEFRITAIRIEGDELEIDFLSKPGARYALFAGNEPASFGEVDDGLIGAAGTITTVTIAKPAVPRQFYQIRKI